MVSDKTVGVLAVAFVASMGVAGAVAFTKAPEAFERVNDAHREQVGGHPSLGEKWLADNDISIFGYGAKADAPTVNQPVEIVYVRADDKIADIINNTPSP